MDIFLYKLFKSNNVVNIYLPSDHYKVTEIDFAYTDQPYFAKSFLFKQKLIFQVLYCDLCLVGYLANMKITIAIRY